MYRSTSVLKRSSQPAKVATSSGVHSDRISSSIRILWARSSVSRRRPSSVIRNLRAIPPGGSGGIRSTRPSRSIAPV